MRSACSAGRNSPKRWEPSTRKIETLRDNQPWPWRESIPANTTDDTIRPSRSHRPFQRRIFYCDTRATIYAKQQHYRIVDIGYDPEIHVGAYCLVVCRLGMCPSSWMFCFESETWSAPSNITTADPRSSINSSLDSTFRQVNRHATFGYIGNIPERKCSSKSVRINVRSFSTAPSFYEEMGNSSCEYYSAAIEHHSAAGLLIVDNNALK